MKPPAPEAAPLWTDPFAPGGDGPFEVADVEEDRCETDPSSGELLLEEERDDAELLFRNRFRNAVLPSG